jgi:hypothetical protein
MGRQHLFQPVAGQPKESLQDVYAVRGVLQLGGVIGERG